MKDIGMFIVFFSCGHWWSLVVIHCHCVSWTLVVTRDHTGSFLVICGHLCSLVAIHCHHGHSWSLVVTCGCSWSLVVIFGYWFSLVVICGQSWLLVVNHDSVKLFERKGRV